MVRRHPVTESSPEATPRWGCRHLPQWAPLETATATRSLLPTGSPVQTCSQQRDDRNPQQREQQTGQEQGHSLAGESRTRVRSRLPTPPRRPPVSSLVRQQRAWGRRFLQRHQPLACQRLLYSHLEPQGWAAEVLPLLSTAAGVQTLQSRRAEKSDVVSYVQAEGWLSTAAVLAQLLEQGATPAQHWKPQQG